jgi:beta-lactamase regulating signal transducer with metallopeptidase domain
MLLPMELMERLNESQREALLLHELVHIQRGDHLVRLLELMVRAAYWWLPLVASITRQLRACEETYCDRAVVAHRPRSRRDYALLLLDVVDFASPLPRHTIPQATPLSAAEGLEQRLGAILDAAPRRRRTSPTGALVVGLACAILPCGLQLDIRANDSAGRDSVRQPGPSRPSAEREPAAEAAARPRVNREVELQAMCCPS